MHSHVLIIEAFGSTRDFADAVGVKFNTAMSWRRRGIPTDHWPSVVQAAHRRDMAFVNADLLLNTRMSDKGSVNLRTKCTGLSQSLQDNLPRVCDEDHALQGAK